MQLSKFLPFPFQANLDEKYKEYVAANRDASTKRCQSLLSKLEARLCTKQRKGAYIRSDGFAEFQKDLQDIEKKYMTHSDLGVQVSGMFLKYIGLNLVRPLDLKISGKDHFWFCQSFSLC